jgi:ketosteroid isomerase-like protein
MTSPRSASDTMHIGERFLAAYGRANADGVAALYDPDVVCEVNVPHWHFTLHGPDAIVNLLRTEEFQPGYRLTSHATRPTTDGAVVEVECRFDSEGEERLAREVHLLRERNGRIIEHVVFCTGIWDSATIQRHDQQTTRP